MEKNQLSRRNFLEKSAVLGAAGIAGMSVFSSCAKNTKTVDYNYEQKNLNPELKAQIYRLFEHVISSLTSRYYFGVGEGGITYNFYIKLNDKTIDCSETWSPTKNSTSYKLVQICEEVMKHASNDSIKKEDIVDKIEKFMK